MNCFQNVTFLGKSQLVSNLLRLELRCELLSKCYFPREITAGNLLDIEMNGCELLSKCYFPREITAYLTEYEDMKLL